MPLKGKALWKIGIKEVNSLPPGHILFNNELILAESLFDFENAENALGEDSTSFISLNHSNSVNSMDDNPSQDNLIKDNSVNLKEYH